MSKNFASPYSKPMHQYPSQSEDYISLEFGGPGKCSTPARPKYQNNNRDNGNGNYYQQRGRGNQHNKFSGGWNNKRSSYSTFADNVQHQQRCYDGGDFSCQTPRRQRYNKTPYHKNNDSYFHPSMLEDPWKYLIERRNAIMKSKIELQVADKQDVGDVLNSNIVEDDKVSVESGTD